MKFRLGTNSRMPDLATQHISPTIKLISIPCDTAILARNARTLKSDRLFAAPGDDGVRYPIMKDRGL